jgi:hypothetical protein
MLLRELKYNLILGAKPGDHEDLIQAIDDVAEHGLKAIHEEVECKVSPRYEFPIVPPPRA